MVRDGGCGGTAWCVVPGRHRHDLPVVVGVSADMHNKSCDRIISMQDDGGIAAGSMRGRECRWLRSDVVGTYCSMCGLLVTPGQRCIARPPVRVESCWGDHQSPCASCALAYEGICTVGRLHGAGLLSCDAWAERAPLPSRVRHVVVEQLMLGGEGE